ncbi:MAG: TonB family protein, partial [Verrucomicrobiota bacterium]|nr:TonB family protein [Verrucomicrobiota bacterium]
MEKTQALLYKPKDRWQIWVCLLGTILLFACAVALVRGEPAEAPTITPADEGIPVTFTPALPEPPPATPEDTPEALPPPDVQSDVAEENPTPAPERKRVPVHTATPIPKTTSAGVAGPASLSSAKVFALSAPRPEYPYEARRQRLTGSGVAVLLIDPASGAVANVSIVRSTGSPILDNAAISGFRRWRFRPGS